MFFGRKSTRSCNIFATSASNTTAHNDACGIPWTVKRSCTHNCFLEEKEGFNKTATYWTNGETTVFDAPASSHTHSSHYFSDQDTFLKDLDASFAQSMSESPVASTGRMSSSGAAAVSAVSEFRRKPSLQTSNMISNSGPSSAKRRFRSSTPIVEDKVTLVRNSILAGSAAGIAQTIMFHPLDVLRTKMQSSALPSAGGRVAGGASAAAAAISPMQAFYRTIQYGGYKSLYTGLSLPLVAQALYKATIFSVNEFSRSLLLQYRTQENQKLGIFEPPKRLNLFETFLCGGAGGAVTAVAFVTPVEFVRNQLIAQHSRLAAAASGNAAGRIMRGPWDVVRHAVRTSGPLGLWRGTGVTIARDSLGCGLYFTMFEIGKRQFGTDAKTGEKNPMGIAMAGALAGLGFWVSALPFDTVKTLVQTGSTNQGTMATMSEIWRRDGLAGLYRGWQVAFGRGAPSAVVTICTYEYCSSLLSGKGL